MLLNFDTVSSLVHRIRTHIAGEFDSFNVTGEISNLYRAASGHYYFTLKDNDAQIKCAWFRPGKNAEVLEKAVAQGQSIKATGRLDIYPPQGSIQIILSAAEIAGEGDLNARFEALYKKLSEAGYFAESHKKKLPQWPLNIGIVTSTSGAAIRDIISVFERRYRQANLLIAATRVQGAGSELEIANAIKRLDSMGLDAIIVARGGGSIEDLWSFNEEIVIATIFKANTPIISGVGHETDVSLCDLAADFRAATPTAAAEALAPDSRQMLASLESLHRRLVRDFSHHILVKRQKLDALESRLIHPSTRIIERRSQIDRIGYLQDSLIKKSISEQKARLNQLTHRLTPPTKQLNEARATLERINNRLQLLFSQKLQNKKHALGQLSGRLDGLSPQSTLERGFSMITDEHGSVISQAINIDSGDKFKVRMQDGEFGAIRE